MAFIECVTVCKDYSDFLEETLPRTMEQVDRLIVVTHPDDWKTRSLCHKYSVDCVATKAMHEDGDAFNKGRAINLGLGHCRGQDWLLHLDADIVLPHNFKNLLKRSKLNKNHLYGADRVNVYGYDHYHAHKNQLTPHYASGYFVEPPREFPLGARIIHKELGYTPIGYFQLWHSSTQKRYPIHQGNAEHTDVLFAAQWDRCERILLPEVIVCHLDSHDGPCEMGMNWNGRKSPPWGPKNPSKHHHPKHHGQHDHDEHCGHGHKPPYKPKKG